MFRINSAFWALSKHPFLFFYQAGSQYLNVVRISLRLLLSEVEMLSTLWDWSCLLDLVQQFADLNQSGEAESLKNVSDIRWCGMQILSIVLKISDKAAADYGLGAEEAFTCLLRLVPSTTYG